MHKDFPKHLADNIYRSVGYWCLTVAKTALKDLAHNVLGDILEYPQIAGTLRAKKARLREIAGFERY